MRKKKLSKKIKDHCVFLLDYTDQKNREDYFIAVAKDYLGAAIRDNTREQKIRMGKEIIAGVFEDPKKGE